MAVIFSQTSYGVMQVNLVEDVRKRRRITGLMPAGGQGGPEFGTFVGTPAAEPAAPVIAPVSSVSGGATNHPISSGPPPEPVVTQPATDSTEPPAA